MDANDEQYLKDSQEWMNAPMGKPIEAIGGVGHYTEFLGTPEDELIAGKVYDNLPRYPSHNLVNRKEAVRAIADGMRAYLLQESGELVRALENVQQGEFERNILPTNKTGAQWLSSAREALNNFRSRHK